MFRGPPRALLAIGPCPALVRRMCRAVKSHNAVLHASPACNAGCCVDQAEQLLMSSVNALRKDGDAAKQPPQLKEKEIGPTLHRIAPALPINLSTPRDRGGPFLSRASHARARAVPMRAADSSVSRLDSSHSHLLEK